MHAIQLNEIPLNVIPLNSCYQYKMNGIVNKFLLAGYKFMLETHLKRPGFTYSDCGLFTKNKQRKNLKS